MKTPRRRPTAAHTLRAQAEELLRRTPHELAHMTGQDVQKLVHELQVHQIELEMQTDELRRAQTALESSRDRLAWLYDASAVGYLTLDAKGVIREANRTAARLLRCDQRLLLGTRLARFVASESQDTLHCHRQDAIASAVQQTCELQMMRPDRTRFWAQLDTVHVQEDGGDAGQYLVTLSDISGRKQGEAQRAHLAAIVESSADAIISRSLEDIITSWNPGAERIFGYTAAEMVGRSFAGLVPPDRRQELAQLRQQVRPGRPVENFETVRLAKGGQRIPVAVTSSAIQDNAGRIIGISSILRDMTRQKQNEAALRQSEESLADFFNHSPLALFWVGADGCIQRVNQAGLALLGHALHECVGRPLARFAADPEVVTDLLDRLANREMVQDQRIRLQLPEGSLKHALVDANGLWEQDQLVRTRWFVRDITARVALEQEILEISEREQQRMARDLHDGQGQLLAATLYLAGTLKNQLAAKALPEAADAARILEVLEEALDQTRSLARGLNPVRTEPNGLMVALHDLAARVRSLFRIACQFTCRRPVLIADNAVATHLYRIAQEAVTNAVKHSQAVRIHVGLAETGSRIVVAVKDNGVGVPKPLPGPEHRGAGIRIMQYRSGLIGGSLVIQKKRGGGTEVVCSIKKPKPLASTA